MKRSLFVFFSLTLLPLLDARPEGMTLSEVNRRFKTAHPKEKVSKGEMKEATEYFLDVVYYQMVGNVVTPMFGSKARALRQMVDFQKYQLREKEGIIAELKKELQYIRKSTRNSLRLVAVG